MRNFGANALMALIAMVCITSIAAGASVSVDSRDVSLGDTFTIDVTVNPQGEEIYGAQYALTFNPAILQVVSQTKGGFLSQDGESSVEIVNKFNNTIGKLEYGETRMGAEGSVTGAGVLASITFEAVSDGSTDLEISNVIVSDPSAKPISGVVLNDGTVNVGGSPPQQIDLTPTTLNIPDSIYADHDYTLDATISNLESGDASAFNVTLKVDSVVVDEERVDELAGNSDTTVGFSWMPETTGSCTLLVEVDSDAEIGESDESNNTLSATVDVLEEGTAGPYVTVDNRDVSIDTFTIDVTIDPQGEEIYGAQYDLTFNPAILQVVSQTKGGFLSQDGESSVEIVNKFNNTIGKLEYGETRMGADGGVTGAGVLASITFEAVSEGSTDLLLSNVILSDPSAQEIGGVVLNDGTVNVGGSSQPLIDLTPTALNIPDSIYADHDYTLDATISNLESGDASAFNVTLKVNGVVVDEERVGGLSGNSDTTVGFSWRPETVGSCTLLVEADSDADISETDEFNNSLSVIVDVLGEPASPPSGTLITIPDVAATGAITVPITIENVSDVGSCQITLTYDPDVVIVSNACCNSDFDSLFANIEDAANGCVRIITYQGASPGLSGDVLVSNVTFMVIGTIGSSTSLDLEVTTLTDATPDCNPIPYTIVNGSFTVLLNGDVNGDGRVDVADCMFLAKHLLGVSGFETIVEAAADVNGNGEIEASDCMYLAKHLAGIDGFEVLK